MVRLTRISTAAALALALVAGPILAHWCAASCESARSVACHHQSAPAPRIGQLPAPCSHDQQPVVVDAATTVAPRVLAIAAAGISIDDEMARVVAEAHARAHHASDSPPLTLTLATILRV